MRLHKNLVEAVIEGLGFIFNDGKYADKVVEQQLKKDKRWGARDRGFIAETIYDIVRWKRLYAKISEVTSPYSIHDLRRMFCVWAVLKGIPLPKWDIFENTPERRIKGKFDQLSKIRVYRESIPDWLDKMACEMMGETLWEKEISALNKPAPVIIRANTLINSVQELQITLQKENIRTELLPLYPDALKLLERSNIFSTQAFKEGRFEVQDASSQTIAPLLDVSPKIKVIDCCAGAGGKTLHLSALMQNKGQIVATDIYPQKLQELKRRAKRNKAFNIETKSIDNKQIKRWNKHFDRVLIDAPCSGTGVLRRNPDAKWKLQPSFINEICATQQDILQKYATMTANNGKLVYATCSILPTENEKQIERFLQSEIGSEFSLLYQEQIFTHSSGYDGFYKALLQRK